MFQIWYHLMWFYRVKYIHSDGHYENQIKFLIGQTVVHSANKNNVMNLIPRKLHEVIVYTNEFLESNESVIFSSAHSDQKRSVTFTETQQELAGRSPTATPSTSSSLPGVTEVGKLSHAPSATSESSSPSIKTTQHKPAWPQVWFYPLSVIRAHCLNESLQSCCLSTCLGLYAANENML